MKKSIIFLLLLYVSGILAQTRDEVLSKVNKNYSDSRPLQFSSIYNLYKNANTKVIHENYKGVFKKNSKGEFYMKIDNTVFINTKKVNLKVVPSEKAMVISEPTEFNTGEFDLKQLLEFCKIKSFEDKINKWELVLETKQFSILPYSHIKVEIDKKFYIKKQFFYYNTGIDFSATYNKQDINYPVLEIVFSNYSRTLTDSNIISTDKYITTKNNKYVSKLIGYEIIDKRQSLTK